MTAKITFDAGNKIIVPTGPPSSDGIIALDAQVDLYSDGKEEWLVDSSLAKMKFPIEPIGGRVVAPGKLGTTYLLRHGWHLRPYEADHTLKISGNIFTDDGSDLILDTIGNYRVRVENEVTLTPPGKGFTPEQEQALFFLKKMIVNTQEINKDGYLVTYDDDGSTPIDTKIIKKVDGSVYTPPSDVPAKRCHCV